MTNIVRTTIPVKDLEVGMSVELYGQILTVGKNDVQKTELWGYSFRGSCAKQQITRVQFAVPTANGIVLR